MQELLELPRARTLIVPDGHSAWWGADVSVSRLALAYAAPGVARGARTVLFADLKGGARLAHIWAETGLFVAELARDGWPLPGLVWVEQPSGSQPNPALSYATGAIQGAIYDAVQRVSGRGVLVETVSSSGWKKIATGYGAHYKPTRAKLGRRPVFDDYGVARWARSLGYAGDSWDEADALGISEAARRSVSLQQR